MVSLHSIKTYPKYGLQRILIENAFGYTWHLLYRCRFLVVEPLLQIFWDTWNNCPIWFDATSRHKKKQTEIPVVLDEYGAGTISRDPRHIIG